MREEIEAMPKVELHFHLDGSVSLEMASKLSGIDKEVLKDKMVAHDKCHDLKEYLTKFDFPISLMQNRENLFMIAKDLVDRLERQNVIYVEVRFAPMFHTKNGLSYDEVVQAVLEGLHSNSKIKTNLILCMMRGMSREDNMKTIEVAEKYLNKGVCAIDLAGDEACYPLDNYREFFEIARSKGIPFTIHAGEVGSAREVETAICLGAKRIGHGIHSIDDERVIDLIRDNDVLLEICPTSNVQTNAVIDYRHHPMEELFKMGVKLNINTDNTTVSNVSLTEEYLKVMEIFNFTLDDIQRMNQYAVLHAFLSFEEKEGLLKKILNGSERI